MVKPVAGRDGQGRPFCARCADRPQRVCGRCGRTRRIARRARDGRPDICDSCFRAPEAVCSRCGRRRPCSFASGPNPICAGCAPRATAPCAHCGADRPPTARWPEGPVCDPCYIKALRRRGTCTVCATERRLVHPPGPDATTCADCAGVPARHACTDCGIEDRAYERGRCAPCSLARRTAAALTGPDGQIRPDLAPVYQAITATKAPRTALNWLRNSAGAALLTQMASGATDLTHQSLDEHPRPGVAGYLRAVLVANQVLPPRDDQLTAAERFLTRTLTGISRDGDRRLVHAYATWQVLRRLRATAARTDRPRTHINHARTNINAAVGLLNWLADHGTTLAEVGQADIDSYLAGQSPSRYRVRDFLKWAAAAGHTDPVTIATPGRNPGPATDHDERWAQIARLLHDEGIELTDRVAGALLLLYGQHLSRIAAMTPQQVRRQVRRYSCAWATTRSPSPNTRTSSGAAVERLAAAGGRTLQRWVDGAGPGRCARVAGLRSAPAAEITMRATRPHFPVSATGDSFVPTGQGGAPDRHGRAGVQAAGLAERAAADAERRPDRAACRGPADRRADPPTAVRHHPGRGDPAGQPARRRRPPDREGPAGPAGGVRLQGPGRRQRRRRRARPHRRTRQPRRRAATRPRDRPGHHAAPGAARAPSPPTAATARPASRTTCTSSACAPW